MWGYGGIGRETARLAKAFNLTVHAMTRDGVKPRTHVYCVPGHGDPEGTLPDKIFGPGQEREFLEKLDFLIMSMPLTPATEGLIGDEFLQILPSQAYLLNPARGRLIREESLLRALRENWIAGAALDTHYYYALPPEHPLWHFPHVIITPHVSGSNLSPHFKTRLWDIIVENCRRFTTGKPLMNQLTSRQLPELKARCSVFGDWFEAQLGCRDVPCFLLISAYRVSPRTVRFRTLPARQRKQRDTARQMR